MAQADPSLVGTEVRHGDATQMSADGRADENLSVDGGGEVNLTLLVEEGGPGKSFFGGGVALGKSSDEDGLSIPDSLHDLSGRQNADVDFLIGVSDIPFSANEPLV